MSSSNGNTSEKYYARYRTALSKMLRESQDRGEGRTVLTSKGFQKYLKKKKIESLNLKSKCNFEPGRKVQLVSCTTFLCNKPSLIKTPSTKSRFFHHTSEEVKSTFISFDTCGIQADSTPNSKACQFLSFILSTSQHTNVQNQSPEWDSCQLQMKHGTVCVSLHHTQGT